MTQEDKDLLLKDLCCRLPYGVICEDEYGNVLELNSIDRPNTITFKCSDNTFWTTDLDKCKPYLFPLSSMTKEQRKELRIAGGYEAREEDCGCHSETFYYNLVGHENVFYPDGNDIDWLNAHHFDYRGLIEKCLAIEITAENNPYK